jgi:hypothetical protein
MSDKSRKTSRLSLVPQASRIAPMADPTAHPGILAAASRTPPCLKKDASAEVIESIRELEARADQCFHSMKILRLPSNVALWSLLVGGDPTG